MSNWLHCGADVSDRVKVIAHARVASRSTDVREATHSTRKDSPAESGEVRS